jgi:CspA family cold shock protein
MKTGILFLYRKEQGFGMIAADGSGEQVFIHHADLPAGLFDTLAQGDRVEFDTLQDTKGLRATNVQKIRNPDEKITVTETDQDGIPGIGGQFQIRIAKKKKPTTKGKPAAKKKKRRK